VEMDSVTKCPNCGKEVTTPKKSLKNNFFYIEAYICENCKKASKYLIRLFFLVALIKAKIFNRNELTKVCGQMV
jgi:hypothetical protein